MTKQIQDLPPYPEDRKYDKGYHYRLCRLLFRSGAAEDIGLAGITLVIYVSLAENRLRYIGPVRFWNSTVQDALSIGKDALATARKAATEAGWLHYDRCNNRRQGYYFTDIPPQFADLSDDSEFVGLIGGDSSVKQNILLNRRLPAESTEDYPPTTNTHNIHVSKSVVVRDEFNEVKAEDVRAAANKLLKLVRKRLLIDERSATFLWQVAGVALALDPDILDDFYDSLKEDRYSDRYVAKPKKWLKAAIGRQCRQHHVEFNDVLQRIPEPMPYGPRQMPVEATSNAV